MRFLLLHLKSFKVLHVLPCKQIVGFLPLPSRKRQKCSTKLLSMEKWISSTDSRKTLLLVTLFQQEQVTVHTRNLLSDRKKNTKNSSLLKEKRWKKRFDNSLLNFKSLVFGETLFFASITKKKKNLLLPW